MAWLLDMLAPERVTCLLPQPASEEKAHTLLFLAELLARHNAIEETFASRNHTQQIYQALAAREALASTGIGGGVAIPHCRLPGMQRTYAALGMRRSGLDFEAVDGGAVHLVFALVAPPRRTSEYLRNLARVARMLRDDSLRQRWIDAADDEALWRMVRETDALF